MSTTSPPRPKRKQVSRNSALSAFNALPVPVCAVDSAGDLLLFNNACEQLTGLASTDVLGKPMVDTLVPAAWQPMVAARLSELDPRGLGIGWQAPWRGADGRLHRLEWVTTRVQPETDEAALVCIGRSVQGDAPDDASRIARDIEFAQLMQMRALGDMTTALAHELSQPLSATVSYLQGSIRLMRLSSAFPTELIGQLENAAAQARRASAIVRHIHRFARHDKPLRRRVELSRLIHDVVTLVAVEVGSEAVAISLDLTDDLPDVTAEPIAIEHVILNLLHNSIEAMAGMRQANTAIPQSTDTTTPTHQISVQTRLSHANAIEVAVEDNGPGIPAEVAQHLFEPFVTAKPGGIGLGLAICRTIIRDHGGDLWLERGTEPGARFVFSLPVWSSSFDDVR